MKKSFLVISASVLILLTACNNNASESSHSESGDKNPASNNFKSPKTELTVDEALALSNEGALIIDVRESDELAELAYDVPNIKHIPLGELESRLSEVPKDKQVIMVCRSGGRSGRAQELLQSKGFQNIANMQGGMNAWSEKGLSTIAGGEKKACCENPNSKDCNPDGTCKPEAKNKKCCSDK